MDRDISYLKIYLKMFQISGKYLSTSDLRNDMKN